MRSVVCVCVCGALRVVWWLDEGADEDVLVAARRGLGVGARDEEGQEAVGGLQLLADVHQRVSEGSPCVLGAFTLHYCIFLFNKCKCKCKY